MAESHNLGHKGEDEASEFLKRAGYRILFRNWKWGRNEIDLIAENREFIVFVEVKIRTKNYGLKDEDLVPRQKQRSIINAANGYLQRYHIRKEGRFDVIIIYRDNDSYEINHIPGAYYPTLR